MVIAIVRPHHIHRSRNRGSCEFDFVDAVHREFRYSGRHYYLNANKDIDIPQRHVLCLSPYYNHARMHHWFEAGIKDILAKTNSRLSWFDTGEEMFEHYKYATEPTWKTALYKTLLLPRLFTVQSVKRAYQEFPDRVISHNPNVVVFSSLGYHNAMKLYTRRLKSKHPSIPVIIDTLATNESADELRSAGADYVLAGTDDTSDLIEVIGKHL